jgi:hypothetical protein
MAQFYEKNGSCMEQKNSVRVDPDDEVTWITYKIRGTEKRSNISYDKWRSVIAQEDAMLIVKKNIKSMYILV